jgi:hypothetical protein
MLGSGRRPVQIRRMKATALYDASGDALESVGPVMIGRCCIAARVAIRGSCRKGQRIRLRPDSDRSR